jgi:hypothetical protein
MASEVRAAVEWKVRLEGRILSANARTIRIRTASSQIVELGRHTVPRDFDLSPGKLIRWIAPEIKERKPSGAAAVEPRR